ncbi:MAG: 5-amino-6-(D-ribitylamino)uracil--L-tyrosine 4-hydroxyphenyl transferase CofH [Novosphingobium sp.]
MLDRSEAMTLRGFGATVTYSRKVFIPLTHLCRDVCHYCTFAKAPRRIAAPYLTIDQVLEIARAGEAAGCREALFTLGDRPEARYSAARQALVAMGYASTLDYLRAAAAAVLAETSLLPHLNPGIMSDHDLAALRPVAASMGMMLETTAERLSAKGGPHHGSPDKHPQVRLEALEAAGRMAVPFTTGLLIGIGETRAERLDALEAIRDSHGRHGHVQEVIIQNFRAKDGTRMADHPEPPLEEHLWTIAAARLILGPEMTIQAPPNLRPDDLAAVLRAGVNDWGGVSPVTPDHVNPEAPWPHLKVLDAATAATGRVLTQRLAIGSAFAQEPDRWLAPELAVKVRRAVDARGLPVVDGWHAGGGAVPPLLPQAGGTAASRQLADILGKAQDRATLTEPEIETLFRADGADFGRVVEVADELRRQVKGEAVTYVVNRNINYTNICGYRCGFCAFSKGTAKALRGPAYRLDLEEVARRAAEAWQRGATEVCLQGGIHPDYDGGTYLAIVEAVREAAPGIHIHAFSPLEISHGAASAGMALEPYLQKLKDAGLATLPGTAAEVLHEDVRRIICPDKVSTDEWLAVMRAAHRVGLRSTSTIMFGHVDEYRHWARHLLTLRELQMETGGFTEFVPLPFVHMEAPIWRKGRARSGPSYREAILMQAIGRIALHGAIDNIQASWVKLGEKGALVALSAGVNDLGGVLMDESITRAAGGENGQCFDVERMERTARAAGRFARRRSTLYETMAEPLLVA